MLRNIFLKVLRDQRRAFIWWCLGLALLTLYVVLLYPSIHQNSAQFSKMVNSLPEALRNAFLGESGDFSSPTGFLNSELFFMMLPLIFLFYAIGMGSKAIAGEEERGTLDLLASYPLRRYRIAAGKFAALAAATGALAFVFWLTLTLGGMAVKIEIGWGRMAEATLSAALLGLAFGSIALMLGCAFGKRGLATGVTSALAVGSYLLNSLGPSVKALKPYRILSLFYYNTGGNPLVNGLNGWHVLVFCTVTAVCLAAALWAFDRRDLSV